MNDIASAVERVKHWLKTECVPQRNFGLRVTMIADLRTILAALEHQTARVADVEKERDEWADEADRLLRRWATATEELTRLRAKEAAGREVVAHALDEGETFTCRSADLDQLAEALATKPAGGADE